MPESSPMLAEVLGFFVVAGLLTLMGFGPALLLVSPGGKRIISALGIAPALGYAIIGLISFPLARYVAPVRNWAFPVTAGLTAASLTVAVRDWRQNRAAYRVVASWRAGLGVGAWILICCLVLVGPLILKGMQYAAFRANPSDAFLQMSLSESLRVARWKTILEGAELASSNLEGIKRLAEASPTALFADRGVLRPLALNRAAAVSWAAEILRLPLYRFYHANNLISFALTIPLTLVVGDQLKLPRLLKYLAAPTVAFGFWAKYVLDSDAGYEISTIPVMLLAVIAWIQLEHEPIRAISRSRLLLALALATLVCLYFPLIPVLIIAFGCYYISGWLQGVRSLSAGLWHALTVVFVILILLLSGQIDYSLKNSVFLVLNAGGEARYPPFVLWLIKANDISAVWGLPASILWGGSPINARWLMQNLAGGLGIFLSVALAATTVFAARKSAPVAERIVFAVLIGGFLLVLTSGALRNSRAAGKAFTYVYPYLILCVLIFPRYMDALFKPLLCRFALALMGAWLGTQFILGLYLPYNDLVARVMNAPTKREDYDLSPITKFLDAHRPTRLLIVIPRSGIWSNSAPRPYASEDWTFAYYSMFVFSRYRPYFQSGIIVDNNNQAQNLWLQDMTGPPDYVVILKEVDYVGRMQLGAKVAETTDLALYRTTAGDLATFQREERRLFQEREGETACFQDVCSPPQ